MRRKIMLHGPSSMTVSLPSSWVKQNNLKKGEELDVLESDNSLLIKTVHSSNNSKVAEISFAGLDKDTRQDLILALHKKGYDEIAIAFDSQNAVKELHAFLNSMQLGYEIIRQDPGAILIKSVSNPEAEQFDSLFRRVFRITIEYSKKIEAILVKGEEITYSCLLHEASISRLSNYCKRIIIKERGQNACLTYTIIEELFRISQHLTALLRYLKANDTHLPRSFVRIYSEVTDTLIRVYDLYYKFSVDVYSGVNRSLDIQQRQLGSLEPCGINHCLLSIHQGVESLLNATLAARF